ncbi:MAG: polysaccharide biosynthesis tyrosine autokinase [Actinobacteria bacterium]|nr:polysaccharide biosynthesis tyrosine autokinase [Actinomycetota bacterium]
MLTALAVVMFFGAFASFKKQPQYVAQCQIHFGVILADPSDPESKPIDEIGSIFSQLNFLKSDKIALETSQRLTGMDAMTPPEIQARIANLQVVSAANGPTQDMSYQIADSHWNAPPGVAPGQRAADVCNAVAQSYIQYQKDFASTFFQKRLKQNQLSWNQTNAQLQPVLNRLAQLNLRITAQQGSAQDLAQMAVERESVKVQGDALLASRNTYQQKIEAFRNQLANGIDGGSQLSIPAGPGVPIGADHKKDLIIALIVGLMFGIGITILREYLDDTVRDKESTQRELGIPVLANLPESESIDGLDGPSSQTLESARTLRATLASMGVPQDKNVILVTSTLAKSRTAVLTSLASAFAESGRSVLVLGSDLRSARTHEGFGVANTVGLANVIRGQSAFERAIRPAPGVDGVYVMPCGPVIGNPGELLSSEEMALLLARARRWADVVLLDAPPVLAAADSSILGAYADGVVLVVSAGRTNRHQAIEAKEQLIAAGARVLGAVLVGAEDSAQSTDDFGGDMGNVMPFWGGGYEQNAYEDWYSEEVVSASARMTPRPRQATRREPPKKISAASPRQKPRDEYEIRIPKRQASKPKAPSARPTAKKAQTATKTKPKPKAAAKAKTTKRRTSPAKLERPTRAKSLPAGRAPRPTPISKRRMH